MLQDLTETLCRTDNREGKAMVDRVMTSVKGGTLEAAAAMRAKLDKDGLMDIPTYQEWARTINNAPALISSQVNESHCSKVQECFTIFQSFRFSATRW